MMVRYATADDVRQWFGEVPATMRAMVVERDGKVAAIAGLARMPDHWQAFSAFAPEMRAHGYYLAKLAKQFAGLLEAAPGAVFAIASKTEPTAPALLSRLGFVEQPNGMWRYG